MWKLHARYGKVCSFGATLVWVRLFWPDQCSKEEQQACWNPFSCFVTFLFYFAVSELAWSPPKCFIIVDIQIIRTLPVVLSSVDVLAHNWSIFMSRLHLHWSQRFALSLCAHIMCGPLLEHENASRCCSLGSVWVSRKLQNIVGTQIPEAVCSVLARSRPVQSKLISSQVRQWFGNLQQRVSKLPV